MATGRRVGNPPSNSTTANAHTTSGQGAVAVDPDDLKRDIDKYDDDLGDSKGPNSL